jgi:hypothetical protein
VANGVVLVPNPNTLSAGNTAEKQVDSIVEDIDSVPMVCDDITSSPSAASVVNIFRSQPASSAINMNHQPHDNSFSQHSVFVPMDHNRKAAIPFDVMLMYFAQIIDF